MKSFLLIVALWPGFAYAQSLAERLSAARNISEEDWRQLTNHKTVQYEIDGAPLGYETYRDNNEVIYRLPDGSCINGQWYMQRAAFCFDWRDGPQNCFHHKRLNGEIYIIGLDNGVETQDIQKVARITSLPAMCGPALLSAWEAR